MEDPSIDLGASHMLSERSTIWARPPTLMVLEPNLYKKPWTSLVFVSQGRILNMDVHWKHLDILSH